MMTDPDWWWTPTSMTDAGALVSAVAEDDPLNAEWLVETAFREGRARELVAALATVASLLCSEADRSLRYATGTTLTCLTAAIQRAFAAHPENLAEPAVDDERVQS